MKTRATVIIPTFGNAKFARWAIKSVQNQTVKDIEICIICDGSPDNMVLFLETWNKKTIASRFLHIQNRQGPANLIGIS